MGTPSPAPRQHPRWIVLTALVAVTGAALHLFQWYGGRPLWLDEEMIAINVRDWSFGELSGPLWLGQSAPWGRLLLQRLAVVLLGPSERALRLVPALFGLGTLATALWIGRRWFGAVGALLLMLLCAFGQWTTFYSLELKPYSSDIFWALLLPALAVRAAEDAVPRSAGLKSCATSAGFWTAAIVALFFSNGAVLVTPGCAASLACERWRQAGWRAAWRSSWPATIWLLAFGGHYAMTVRHALSSAALQEYWSFALPPAAAGFGESLRWLSSQLLPFAAKPGGAGWPLLFWIAFGIGTASLLKQQFPRGFVLALIPLTAFSLALLRLVPLFERLSLWVVPGLFLGIAAGGDMWRAARRERGRWTFLPGAAMAVAVALLCSADIVSQGLYDLRMNRPRASNHDLNDREAVTWLMAQREPDDDLVTTRQGLPAVWWYGRLRLDGPHLGGGFEQDGGLVYAVRHEAIGPACRANLLADRLRNRRRVLVYFGFRVGDVPDGFDQMLVDDLAAVGTIVADQRFSTLSRALVVNLGARDSRAVARPPSPGRPSGCLTLEPGQHW